MAQESTTLVETKACSACWRASPVSSPIPRADLPGPRAAYTRLSTVPKTDAPRALPSVWKKRTPVVATPSWWAGAVSWTSWMSCPTSWPKPRPIISIAARTVHRLVSVVRVAGRARAAEAQAVPLTTNVFCDQPAEARRPEARRPEARPTTVMPTAIGIR